MDSSEGQGRPGAGPEEAGRAGAQGACGLASARTGGGNPGDLGGENGTKNGGESP